MKKISALKQRLGVRLFKLAFNPDYLNASQKERCNLIQGAHGRKK